MHTVGHHHAFFRHCSHPPSSSSYVRCNVCSAPSQASACLPKMFHILSGFGRPRLSLAVHLCVLSAVRHCYRNTRVFCRHPSRDWWSTIVSFCTTPSFLFSFIPLDCIYRVRFGIQSKRGLVGCLVRFFLVRLRFSVSNLPVRYE